MWRVEQTTYQYNNISFYVPAKFYHITNDNHSISKDPHIMFSWFFQLHDLYACFFVVVVFFFLQDIYYANNKELIKKKLLTKFQTTLITEGEKKGKVLHDTYNYLHFTIIFVTAGRYSLSGPLCRSLSCNLRFAQLLCRCHRRKRQVKGTGSV